MNSVTAFPLSRPWHLSRRWLALTLLHGYTLFVPAIPTLPLGNLQVGALDLLFVLALPVLVLQRHFRITLSILGLAGFCFTALVSVAIIDDSSRTGALLRAVRLIEIAMPLFLASSVRLTREEVRKLFRSFLIGGVTSILIGIVIFVFQIPFGDVQRYRFPTGEMLDRAGGIFSDSSAYGHLVATWLIIGLGTLPAFVQRRRATLLLRALIFLAIGGFALYGSVSRSAFLGLIAAACVGLIFPVPRSWRSAQLRVSLRLALLSVLLAVAFVFIAPHSAWRTATFINQRLVYGTFGALLNVEEANRITSGRIENWTNYLPYVLENPLTGIGYKALILERGIPPDNNYLSVLVETGLIGLALFLVFLGGTFIALFFAYLRGNPFAWTLLLVWSAQAAMALAIDVITFWGTIPGLLVLTGVVLQVRPPVVVQIGDTRKCCQ
jgi:O-antigen ligase